MTKSTPLGHAVLGCLVGLLTGLLNPAGATAQPIELFDQAPSIQELGGSSGQGYMIPEGDWTKYRAWLSRGTPPSGPLAAFIDSGVLSEHPYIRPVLKDAIDLTGEGAEDAVGHGTFVALIYLMGLGDAVAPIISIKVLGRTATLSGSDLMVRALRRAEAEGAKIINVSAGVFLECANARDPAASPFLQQCEETPICKAVEELATNKVFVIAAVGNTPGKTGCPACCRKAFAVGAVDENGKPASYSGAFPDVLTPGTVRKIPLRRAEP